MGDFEVVGLAKIESDLKSRSAKIKGNGKAATKAYVQVIQTAAKAKAIPRRKGTGTAKSQARKRDSSQWSRVPEPIVHANLPGHVKVFSVDAHASKVRLTGRVWHLILGAVKAHEVTAGTFRERASGRTALQMVTGGYARHAVIPGHSGLPHWLGEIHESVRTEAMTAAKEVLLRDT
jgi:hypothetical protein